MAAPFVLGWSYCWLTRCPRPPFQRPNCLLTPSASSALPFDPGKTVLGRSRWITDTAARLRSLLARRHISIRSQRDRSAGEDAQQLYERESFLPDPDRPNCSAHGGYRGAVSIAIANGLSPKPLDRV